jgi:hypothetical protein
VFVSLQSKGAEILQGFGSQAGVELGLAKTSAVFTGALLRRLPRETDRQ